MNQKEYNLNDTVFFMFNDKIEVGKVKGITINHNLDDELNATTNRHYTIKPQSDSKPGWCQVYKPEGEVFDLYSDLLKFLEKQFVINNNYARFYE